MGIDAQMLLKVPGKVNSKQVKKWSYDVCEAFLSDNFFIDRERKRHALSITKEFTQDGDSIIPNIDETLIEVNLWTRYYGEGYERGNFPLIKTLAEYFEKKIEGCKVYYGGDSSGVCAELFDKKRRESMFEHFVDRGHKEYHFNTAQGPECEFCEHPMIQYGWGGGYEAFRCAGCGYKYEVREGVKTEIKE